MKTAAPKKTAKPKACKCVEQVNELLRPFNTRICKTVTMSSEPVSLAITMTIETEKIDPKVRGSKRRVMPSYCPFCGKKL